MAAAAILKNRQIAISPTVVPILTINTSYDVFPPKEVPFGGGDDIAPHLGGQISPKPQFLGRE